MLDPYQAMAALPPGDHPLVARSGGKLKVPYQLGAAARVYMDSEYATGGNRMEAIVTSILIPDGSEFTMT